MLILLNLIYTFYLTCRITYNRAGTVHNLQGQNIQQCQQPRPRICKKKAEGMPAGRPEFELGAARSGDAEVLRQLLLQELAAEEGPPHLRPGSLQRRLHRRHCDRVQQKWEVL